METLIHITLKNQCLPLQGENWVKTRWKSGKNQEKIRWKPGENQVKAQWKPGKNQVKIRRKRSKWDIWCCFQRGGDFSAWLSLLLMAELHSSGKQHSEAKNSGILSSQEPQPDFHSQGVLGMTPSCQHSALAAFTAGGSIVKIKVFFRETLALISKFAWVFSVWISAFELVRECSRDVPKCYFRAISGWLFSSSTAFIVS